MFIKHENKKYFIPSKASELTYQDFLKVWDWDGIHEAEFLEKLLEIDYATALELVDGYLKESDFEFFRNTEYPRPDKIEIFGKKYRVHENLFKESTTGQIATFKGLLEIVKQDEWETKIYPLLPKILAIYFYPAIRKTLFTSVKYQEIIYLIEKCSYVDVLGVGFFLLKSYGDWLVWKAKRSVSQAQNKEKQELTDSVNSE